MLLISLMNSFCLVGTRGIRESVIQPASRFESKNLLSCNSMVLTLEKRSKLALGVVESMVM